MLVVGGAAHAAGVSDPGRPREDDEPSDARGTDALKSPAGTPDGGVLPLKRARVDEPNDDDWVPL